MKKIETDMESTSSTKPYLLRAIWEWCADNNLTPYLAVVVDKYTRVPPEFVRDGRIVLNIGDSATNRLQMGNDFVQFQARFSGVVRDLSIPINAVEGIFAKETGEGLSFEVEPYELSSEEEAKASEPATAVPVATETNGAEVAGNKVTPFKRPSHLQVVK